MDDLTIALGQDRVPDRRPSIAIVASKTVLVLSSLCVVVLAGWALLAHDPLGGEPTAVAVIPTASPARTADPANTRPAVQGDRPSHSGVFLPDSSPSSAAGKTVTIIDGTSGKRQEIVIPGHAGANPAGGDPSLTGSAHR